MEERKTWYLCDPERNTDCRKSSCGWLRRGRCWLTSRRAYAKTDENGAPLTSGDPRTAAAIDREREKQNLQPMKKPERQMLKRAGRTDPDRPARTVMVRPDPGERETLDRTIREMCRIWEVGIVNAREDRQAIHEAIGFLETLKHIWHI